MRQTLKSAGKYDLFTGVGGIGTGMFFALSGNDTLGRNESRPARLLDVRDYCKLHIIAHYFCVLSGGATDGSGPRVLPIGKIGDDEAGRRLAREMAEVGMDTRFVEALSDRPTLLSVCFQYPDGSGGNITTSAAAAAALRPADIDEAEPMIAASAGRFVALAAPEAPLDERHYMLKVATKYRGFRAASFASAEIPQVLETKMLSLVDLVSVNEDEAGAIARLDFTADPLERFLDGVATTLTRFNPEMRIILTAGKAGAYGYERGIWRHTPTPDVEVASTAGAGDALFGATLAGLAAGMPFIAPGEERASITHEPLSSALDLAVLFASLTVASPHTIHPEADLAALVEFAKKTGVAFSEDIMSRFA